MATSPIPGSEWISAPMSTRSPGTRCTVRSGLSTRTDRMADRLPASGSSSETHETITVSRSIQFHVSVRYASGESKTKPSAQILHAASTLNITVNTHSHAVAQSGVSSSSGFCAAIVTELTMMRRSTTRSNHGYSTRSMNRLRTLCSTSHRPNARP